MRVIFSACALALIPVSAFAEPVVWTGQVSLRGFDCLKEKREGIVIQGSVSLLHPDDLSPEGPVQEIIIACTSLAFEPGSQLSSISKMDIRIDGTSSGAIKIINSRGVPGKDAPPTPEIWKPFKMPNGGNVGGGGNGRDASGCAGIDDKDSDPGGDGGRGQDGQSGLLHAASPGANGSSGNTAADVYFLTRFVADGSTIEIIANGGNGGMGGLGGRGADGGDGGNGGVGGQGGDANTCHTASRGGNGGNGGNGGDGGNGGQGGNGGDGGNGGTVVVAIQEGAGNKATPPKISNTGGKGGAPGLGGEAGLGGKGGLGGGGGWGGGGDGGIFGTGIESKRPGSGGLGGGNGVDGKDGERGPMGVWGKDGQNGRIGPGFSGTLPKEGLDKLIKPSS